MSSATRKIAADDTYFVLFIRSLFIFIFYLFIYDLFFLSSKKIMLDVSWAKHRNGMKYQVLFSLLKNTEKVFMNVVCCSRD